MNRLLSLFGWRDQHDAASPLSLWNDIFLVAAGFFSLGVSLFGFLVELGPRFVAGAHVEMAPLVSYALIGSIALFLIGEGFLRIDRTIHELDERLKPTPVLD